MSELGPAAYFDTSALVKLVRPEPESDSIIDFVQSSDLDLTSVELAEVELLRAIRRDSRNETRRARIVLDQVIVLPFTGPIRERAIAINPPSIGSLDAIHVATAIEIRPHLGGFVTYDKKMAEAAAACDLPVLSPGT